MYVKYEELNEFIDLLNDNEKLLVNEPSIKNELLKAYIDAKFYNEGEIPNSSHMENIERIKKYIANYGKELIANYYNLNLPTVSHITWQVLNRRAGIDHYNCHNCRDKHN